MCQGSGCSERTHWDRACSGRADAPLRLVRTARGSRSGSAGRAQVQLKDVVKVLAMAEAALKAKSVAAERKAFVAATHAYEQGAALQAMTHACVQHGQGELAKCMEQVRVGTR